MHMTSTSAAKFALIRDAGQGGFTGEAENNVVKRALAEGFDL